MDVETSASHLVAGVICLALRSVTRWLIGSPSPTLASSPTSTALHVPPRRPRPRPRPRPRIPAALRFRVWETYSGGSNSLLGRCFVCQSQIRFSSFHCGHVLAVAKGGATSLDNLRPLCSLCNTSMGAENLFVFREKHFRKLPPGKDNSRRSQGM